MPSMSVKDLHAPVKEKALMLFERCRQEGLDILLYCTLRSLEEQARLFRLGRRLSQIRAKAQELREQWKRPDLAEILLSVGPQHGRRVTYSGPGQSLHNYGLAFDAVPLRDGKPVWQTNCQKDLELWDLYGRLGMETGLEWAGTWTRFREFPHMQAPDTTWHACIGQKDHAPVIPENRPGTPLHV